MPNIVRRLETLAREWDDGYWIFSADGAINLMKCGPDGERVYTECGGVDPDYIVKKFAIPSDGGDW